MGDYPKLTLLNSIKCSVEILASFKTIQRICIIYCEIKFFQDHLDMRLIVHGKHPSIWLLSRPLLDNSLCIGQCVLHELTPFKTISICQNALSIRISFFQDHTSNAQIDSFQDHYIGLYRHFILHGKLPSIWLLSRPLLENSLCIGQCVLHELTPFKTISVYHNELSIGIRFFQDHMSKVQIWLLSRPLHCFIQAFQSPWETTQNWLFLIASSVRLKF